MAYETTIAERKAAQRRDGGPARGPGAAQAFSLLHFAAIATFLVAGLDKFFHYLVDWNIYVSPAYAALAGGNAAKLMSWAGAVEIVIGVVVAARPRLGGVLAALWLWAVIVNLLLIPGYFDVALRDFGLSLAALALSRLGAAEGA